MGRPRISGVTELTNKIILAFAEGGVVRRNAYWFRPDIAIQIIQQAKETRTAIFGFYAATIGRYDVYESLENSWNYVAALRRSKIRMSTQFNLFPNAGNPDLGSL